MGFAGWGVLAEAGARGADGPGDGGRDQRGEEVQLGRVGQTGVLEVEPARLGVAELGRADLAALRPIWPLTARFGLASARSWRQSCPVEPVVRWMSERSLG